MAKTTQTRKRDKVKKTQEEQTKGTQMCAEEKDNKLKQRLDRCWKNNPDQIF